MAQPQERLAPAEYLALERAASTRSEYVGGEIFAMAGASRQHNLITGNVIRELGSQLRRKPCEVYPSDMRVKVASTGLYTYPDVVVVCEEPAFEDAELDTLLNPTVLVEVLSKSTADYDLGRKFEQYRTLPSLREVLFVAQGSVHLVHCRRQSDDTWILSETRDANERLAMTSIGAELPVAEVYAKVRFAELAGPVGWLARPGMTLAGPA